MHAPMKRALILLLKQWSALVWAQAFASVGMTKERAVLHLDADEGDGSKLVLSSSYIANPPMASATSSPPITKSAKCLLGAMDCLVPNVTMNSAVTFSNLSMSVRGGGPSWR